MKKFVFLTYGFEKPTPEIMRAWGRWFASIKENIVDQYGLANGREISRDGEKALPLDREAITGIMVVSAENREDAERMARSNPFITSIRIYEMMQN